MLSSQVPRGEPSFDEQYRLLFDRNPSPMWVFDMETLAFLDVNEAAIEHYGYSRDELAEMTVEDIRPREDLEAYRATRARLRETDLGEVVHAGAWRHRKKDGTIIDVEVRTSRLVFKGRDAKLVLANDVTERRRLEEQLRQAQKMEAIGRIAGGVAHDFNNILAVILASAELMEEGLPAGTEAREDLQQIMDSAHRASRLVRQLLQFSRRQIIEPRMVDAGALAVAMESMLTRALGEDISLATSAAPDLWRVRIDPSHLEQILINLAVNAREAMPRGGKVTIETGNVVLDEAYARGHAGVVPGEYVMLAVSDDGEGMTPEVQAHIFEPFFTTKKSGTGLGLATCYGIVKQVAGDISVYSEVGRGTTFKIYLPRASEETKAEVESAARAGGVPAVQGTETIFVVEDEDAVRSMLVRALAKSGYNVLAAVHGVHALKVGAEHGGPIHLLVTDVVMPEMGGPELVEKWVAIHPESKVLYMSGYTAHGIVHRGELQPGLTFMQKPFTPKTLLEKVKGLLTS